MMVLHGDLGNPYTLWTAAQSVFEQGQGASSWARWRPCPLLPAASSLSAATAPPGGRDTGHADPRARNVGEPRDHDEIVRVLAAHSS
jgi:hypothetical protein